MQPCRNAEGCCGESELSVSASASPQQASTDAGRLVSFVDFFKKKTKDAFRWSCEGAILGYLPKEQLFSLLCLGAQAFWDVPGSAGAFKCGNVLLSRGYPVSSAPPSSQASWQLRPRRDPTCQYANTLTLFQALGLFALARQREEVSRLYISLCF